MDVGSGSDAAFGDQQRFRRQSRSEAWRGGEIGAQTVQVAVVDPDDRRARRDRAANLVRVVRFDEHVQSRFGRDAEQVRHCSVVQDADDQQHRVRTRGPCFPDLEGIDEEVFAENGEGAGAARFPKIVQRAPEEFPIGKHRQGRGTPGCVGRGGLRGGGVGAEWARRRRLAFELRDHLDPVARGERRREATRGGLIGGAAPKFRQPRPQFSDLAMLGGDDSVEQTGATIGSRRGWLHFGVHSGIVVRRLFGCAFHFGDLVALTKKQRELLDHLRAYIDEHGFAPSYEEIAAHFNLSSLATVHEHLTNLAQKGYIRKNYNLIRALELVPDDNTERAVVLPLLGQVDAGVPIDAIAERETISVPQNLCRPGRNYVLKVRGNSMIDEQIRDGDLVVVNSRPTADDGEMVVALVGGDSATVKKFYRESDGRIRLQPANPGMLPMFFEARDVQVQGVVVGVIRRY